MRVFWPNRISNERLLQTTAQEEMVVILKRRRWKWLGHVMRLDTSIPARTALTWAPEGKRKRGRPKSTWRRTIEKELENAGYTWGTAKKVAQDREATRHEEDERVIVGRDCIVQEKFHLIARYSIEVVRPPGGKLRTIKFSTESCE